jgi:hypothetical protein
MMNPFFSTGRIDNRHVAFKLRGRYSVQTGWAMGKTFSWWTSAVLAVGCLMFTGCAAIAGDQSAEVDLNVHPGADGHFNYHNTLTVDLGPASISTAQLTGVTFTTIEPANTPDLSYITSLLGDGVTADGQLQPFVTYGAFPAGQPSVDGIVVFAGNIVPFFDDTESLHIQWTGTVNLAYPNFPADGFKVSAILQVDPQ